MKKLDPAARPLHAKDTLHIYWQTARRYPGLLMLVALYPLSMIILGVGIPYCTGLILGNITNTAAPMSEYLWALAIVSAIGALTNFIGFRSFWLLQANMLSDMMAKSLDIMLRRSVGFHNNNMSGKLVSDALDFQQSFATFASTTVIGTLPFLLVLIIGLTVVSLHSLMLALGLGVTIVVTFAWALYDSRIRAGLRSRRLVATKNMVGHFSDTIINAQTVKAFAGEQREHTQHVALNTILRNLRHHDWLRANRSSAERMAALLGFQVGFLVLIVHEVRQNPALLSIGIFALTYTFMLIQKLFDLNMLLRNLEESLLQASPMTAIRMEDIEIKDKPGAQALQVTRGAIKLHDVRFNYAADGGAGEVFEHLSLDIKPGEKLGLAGPSGGGKSTFTRLLLRFEDISQGEIIIDRQNIADVTQESLRAHIAYVAQEPLLFHRSIRENIAYGLPGASEAAVIAAAKKAHAHEFITALPCGYDTIVGERGVKLSGGQRQRVAIARAILKDAPILILDEATSALDSESEALVQEALWKLMEGRTAIVIAHRLSTIQKMDRIIVLKDGSIVEEGPHADLIKKGGTYATLWSHQSGGFVRDEDEESQDSDQNSEE